MKALCSFLLLFVTTTSLWSQTTYTWNGGNGSWTVAGNWLPNGVPGNNDIVQFTNTGTKTISGISSNYSLDKLTVSGNSNIILENTGSKTLTIGDGTGTDFIINSGSTLTMGSNIKIVVANNTQATIAGTLVITDKNFDTNNSGVVTTVTGTLQNNGANINSNANTLVFANGGKYIHERSGGSVPTATWAAASTCEITGLTSGDPGGDNQDFGNLVYNCPGMSGNRNIGGSGLTIAGTFQIINTGTATLQLPTTLLEVSGDFILNSGTFRIGNNTNRTVTVTGNVSITGGTLLMSTGSNVNDMGVLNVAGNFSQSGGLIDEDNNGSGEINFNGTSVQTFSKSGGTISNEINFTINNGAAVDFGTSVLDGSTGTFALQQGAKIILGSSLNSSGNSGAVQVSGARTFSSDADYEFKGSTTGIFTTTPLVNTARDIIIDNPTGNVTLSQPMTVTRDLTLLNGELKTSSSNLVTINNNATASGYSDLSFIDGPVVKKGDDDFVFPVGRSGAGLVPIKISGLSGSSDFKAEYKRANALTALGSIISAIGLYRISACEYWTLDRTGSATANVTLYWGAQSSCNAAAYVTDISSIVAAHFNGLSWNAYGRDGGTTGSISNGSVTWNAVSNFSPFVLGSISAINNPLPVSLANVKAYKKNNGVQVEWSNMTEKDLDKYVVERSGNGSDFTALGVYLPQRNNNDRADYTVFDAAPLQGLNYYRIVATGINGKTIISPVLRVQMETGNQSLLIYPNPVVNSRFTINMTGTMPGKYMLQLVNTSGNEILVKTIITSGSSITENVELSSAIRPGVYTLILTGNQYRQSKLLIIK